jgi:iron complex outermembrane recepter protein
MPIHKNNTKSKESILKKTRLILAVCTAFSPLLEAQDVSLDDLTVTSTPLHDTELNAPAAVEVYTAEEIEKSHVQSVYEFLNLQTSVFAIPNYGNPMTQNIDMHGYGLENGYENIVVTVNGRRLNNIDMVPQLLSAISPANVERLEIVKGSGVVLNGNGANAGAINIITKENPSNAVSFYGGIYNTYDAAFQVSHTEGMLNVSATGEAYHTAGTRHIDAAQDRDEQTLADGTLNVTLTPTDALELRLGFAAARTNASYGSALTLDQYQADPAQPGTYPSPAYQQYSTDTLSAGITYLAGHNITLNLDAAREKKRMNADMPVYTYQSVTDYDYRTLKASAEYNDRGLQLIGGADLFDGTANLSSVYAGYASGAKTSEKNLAGYVLAQYRTGSHTFKAGYRYERVTYDFSDNNGTRDNMQGVEAGYNYRIDRDRSLFASYAHAYQTPDINRFYNTINFVYAFGQINPMTSDTFTAGYTAISPKNKLKLSAYYAALKNEFYYYSEPTAGTWANTNIDRSHKYGLDLYDLWMITKKIGLSVNYNYVQAIIDEEQMGTQNFSGNTLPGVSNQSVKAALIYMPTPALTCTLSHTYRSEAYALNDIGNDFAQKQQAYNSTDLSINYDKASYALFAKINNMFNHANGLWIQDNTIYPVNFTTTAIAGATLKF